MKYHGELVEPYFSASCGGVTQAAKDIWPDRGQPYLASVRDPYCAGSEHASWQRVLTMQALNTILRADLRLPLEGPLSDLSIEKKDASGRAHTLRVVAGSDQRIDANEFRYAANRRLGWATIKSNFYTLDRRGDTLVFTGRGLGHGVGLCQAGTEQMGRMGFSPERILATYFPGTTVAPLSSGEPDSIASSEHCELVFPASEQTWVQPTLEAFENSYREVATRAYALPKRVRMRTWPTSEEFIRATGQPGWQAAGGNGQSIALQPLSLLHRKRILKQTLRHELMHLAVHWLRAAQVPRWFEEGMVLYLTHEQVPATPNSVGAGRNLEVAISKPHSEAEMKAAYAQALMRVQELSRERGEPALWRVLQHPTAEDLRRLHGTP